jgi:hypothetical protein
MGSRVPRPVEANVCPEEEGGGGGGYMGRLKQEWKIERRAG